MRFPIRQTLCTLVVAGLLAGPAIAAEVTLPAKTEPTGKMGWTGILSEEQFKRLHIPTKKQLPPLHGEDIELAGGKAYVSYPIGDGPFPGLVVIQEWWGLNDHIRHWTDRLAADGYAAIAVDLYDGTVATTSDEAMAAMKNVDPARAREILDAARDFLKTNPRVLTNRIGTIGWCFGGGWSLNCALAWPELEACVLYYGRLVTDPAELKRIGAAVCAVFGDEDQSFPPAVVDEFEAALQAAGVTHEIHRYPAGHAFANPSGGNYVEEHAADAFEKVRKFLAKELKTG